MKRIRKLKEANTYADMVWDCLTDPAKPGSEQWKKRDDNFFVRGKKFGIEVKKDGDTYIGTDWMYNYILWNGTADEFVKNYKGIKGHKLIFGNSFIGGLNDSLMKKNGKFSEANLFDLEDFLTSDGTWEKEDDDFYWTIYGFGLYIDGDSIEVGTGEEYMILLWKGSLNDFVRKYGGCHGRPGRYGIIEIGGEEYEAEWA